MALRDQPYLPLYVDKFAGDEKLRDCSAAATGVHIRLMCLLHKAKSKEYGTLELKDNLKNELIKEIEKNFALANGEANGQHLAEKLASPPCSLLAKYFAQQFVKQFPYSELIIEHGLIELYNNDVIEFNGFFISQQGMIKQGNISDKRSIAGKKGIIKKLKNLKTPQKKNLKTEDNFAIPFALAKDEANPIIITTTINKDKKNKDKGGIDNIRGGTGEEKIGGKRKKAKEYLSQQNEEQEIMERMYEIGDFLNIYFTSTKYSRTRELVATSFYMDLDMLRLWAEAFNEHLLSCGQNLNDDGMVIKQESDWAKHFRFWLAKQNLNKNPKELNKEKINTNGQQAGNQNGTIKGHQPFDMQSAVSKLDKLTD